MRMGVLRFLKLRDLEKIDEAYKITVYSGDKEEYFTFCTPECAKEIDAYIDLYLIFCYATFEITQNLL